MNLELDETKYTQGLMLKSNGDYESEISGFMRSILKPEDCFVDCGAHVGYFTTLGAELCSSVYSIEPEKENFISLAHNIEINKYKNVKAFNCCVGDENKEVELFINLDNDGGNALWDVSKHPFNKKTKLNGNTFQKVRMVTLDSFINEPVKLIKIDVEGCELKVLQGAKELLGKYHPAVILEINDFALKNMGTNKGDIISFMSSLGYTCYDLQTGEQLDLQTNVVHEYVYNVVFIKLITN